MYTKLKSIISALLIALFLSGCGTAYEKGKLSVVYIDTGNSDSIFINYPDGRKMLIDGADVDDRPKILKVLNQYKTQKLDWIVVTHPHSDHMGSIPAVMQVYDFDKLYMPKLDVKSEILNEIAVQANNRGKPFTQAKAGLVISDDSVRAEILSPMHEHYGEENDYSAVVYLTYGKTSFLFMGDAEKAVENDLLKANKVPHADVLKVGHHGSKTSSGKNFLNAVNPVYAVITTGKNTYGHPNKETTSLLNAMQIETFRTDLAGNVTFVSDGGTVVKQ
jgi:competence protein ComEC